MSLGVGFEVMLSCVWFPIVEWSWVLCGFSGNFGISLEFSCRVYVVGDLVVSESF